MIPIIDIREGKYENKTPVNIEGVITNIEEIEGKTYVDYTIQDKTSSIVVRSFKMRLEGFEVTDMVIITGRVNVYHPDPVKYPHPLITINLKDMKHPTDRTAQHIAEKRATENFHAAVKSIQKTHTESPMVGVQFENYVPEEWVRKRLLGILEDMEEIRKKLEVGK